MRHKRLALLAGLCGLALADNNAWAQQRFAGRIAGGGANCVAVMLDLAIDGGSVSGGGTLAVSSRTPVSVSGTRSGDSVVFIIQHGASVGDQRLQRIPMVGKFLAADRLEVWQERDSQTCNPARRGVLTRQ